MPYVLSNDLEKLRQETDAKENLRWSLHAPGKKVYERHYSIGLEHVVTIFSQSAKDLNNLDAHFNHFAHVFEFRFGTNIDSLAYVYQSGDEFQFSH